MKLYFYVFMDNKIEFTECEVEEKPKSYILLEKVPDFYGSRILKSEIGLKTEYNWKQVVILDKRDDKLAKKYLSDYIDKEIEERQKEITRFQKQMVIINEWGKQAYPSVKNCVMGLPYSDNTLNSILEQLENLKESAEKETSYHFDRCSDYPCEYNAADLSKERYKTLCEVIEIIKSGYIVNK